MWDYMSLSGNVIIFHVKNHGDILPSQKWKHSPNPISFFCLTKKKKENLTFLNFFHFAFWFQFVCVSFWTLYTYNRELVYPKSLDGVIPLWLNHAMVSKKHLSLLQRKGRFCNVCPTTALFRFPEELHSFSFLTSSFLLIWIWCWAVCSNQMHVLEAASRAQGTSVNRCLSNLWSQWNDV